MAVFVDGLEATRYILDYADGLAERDRLRRELEEHLNEAFQRPGWFQDFREPWPRLDNLPKVAVLMEYDYTKSRVEVPDVGNRVISHYEYFPLPIDPRDLDDFKSLPSAVQVNYVLQSKSVQMDRATGRPYLMYLYVREP